MWACNNPAPREGQKMRVLLGMRTRGGIIMTGIIDDRLQCSSNLGSLPGVPINLSYSAWRRCREARGKLNCWRPFARFLPLSTTSRWTRPLPISGANHPPSTPAATLAILRRSKEHRFTVTLILESQPGLDLWRRRRPTPTPV